MPRQATGNVYERRGKWYARLTIGEHKRQSFVLPTSSDKASAEARQPLLAELAKKLRKAGRDDIAPEIIKRAAAREGKAFAKVCRAVEMIAAGEVVAKKMTPTFRELGERWTSGELAREYPDHVKAKLHPKEDLYRLERHIYPLVGDIPINAFTLDHAQAVMRSLPTRAPETRRQYAQTIRRILKLAVFPLRLIQVHPLPPGFVPKQGPRKAKGWLYPSEEAALLACKEVPLCYRIFYGFLHREGSRRNEALRMTWADLNLAQGAVTLDTNKTNDPRLWALSPDVVEALKVWRRIRAQEGGGTDGDAPVFVNERGTAITRNQSAEYFRKYLKAAGITRTELFKTTDARRQIRLHDTRATFITIALANGKSETWVQDRTGHKSSNEINRYRRAARTAAELHLGELAPLDMALPEIAAVLAERAAEKATPPGSRRGGSSRKRPVSGMLATIRPPAKLPERTSGLLY